MSTSQLKFGVHTGRAILNQAADFNTPQKAVWEYAVNSLQYVDSGNHPIVSVRVSKSSREIEISDNGRGMDREVLTTFFTLNAENIDRKQGSSGRGKFGTGKCAAFGIGESLTVDTVKDGVRNVVQVTKTVIAESDGSVIPVDSIVVDEPHSGPNGTTIKIGGIAQPARLKVNVIKKHIERLLEQWIHASPTVTLNSELCQWTEPETHGKTYTFKPDARQQKIIGEVTLNLSVSVKPLGELSGVAVTAGPGHLVGRERCGIDKKPQGEYILGNVDVPSLDSDEYDIQPFDSSRRLILNHEHPVVRSLLGFIGSAMEKVRKEQVSNLEQAEDDERHRRLNKEADRITEILNEDFNELLLDTMNAVSRSSAQADPFDKDYVSGSSEPGDIDSSNVPGKNDRSPSDSEPTFADISSPGQSNPDGLDTVDPDLERSNGRSARFNVEYRNLGITQDRSVYEKSTLTIVINLAHPVLEQALISSSVEDPVFRRLSYEIAFSEYAFAVGWERLKRDSIYPGDDLLYDIRETLNRVSKSAASLYRS